MKKKKEKRSKIEDDKFFSTLFGGKDFMSQESLILADYKNIISLSQIYILII